MCILQVSLEALFPFKIFPSITEFRVNSMEKNVQYILLYTPGEMKEYWVIT